MKKEEEVEKTYSLDFKDDKFIFTDNYTNHSKQVSTEVAFANSNQVDVEVSDIVIAQLAYLGL